MRAIDRREVLLVSGLLSVFTFGIVTAYVPLDYVALTARGHVHNGCTLSLARTSRAREAQRRDIFAATRPEPSSAVPDDGAFRWDTPGGPVWTPKADAAGAQSAGVFFHGPPIPRWTPIENSDAGTIRSGDVVMDAGAHLGESTLHALSMGASLVIAVEPVPENLRALRRNLANAIADRRVVVVEKGVFDREGVLAFQHGHSWDGWFHQVGGTHEGEGDSLPVTTIDRIVSELNLQRLDFIKMDIEGSEPFALAGASETLKRFKPRISVGTYHRPSDLEKIPEAVLRANPSYRSLPSRCLVDNGRLYPHLLYFY